MGWCSGTDIFDRLAQIILDQTDLLVETQLEMLVTVIQALEDHDWDCQSDSQLYGIPVIQQAFKRLHPDWFDEIDYYESLKQLGYDKNDFSISAYRTNPSSNWGDYVAARVTYVPKEISISCTYYPIYEENLKQCMQAMLRYLNQPTVAR